MTRATIKILLAAALVSGTASAIGAPVAAQGVAFRYKDLDLSTDAGRAELEKRIAAVVRQACPDETVTGSRMAVAGAREQCTADVRRQIMSRIEARTGGGSSSS